MTKVGLDALGTSTPLESNKSLTGIRNPPSRVMYQAAGSQREEQTMSD